MCVCVCCLIVHVCLYDVSSLSQHHWRCCYCWCFASAVAPAPFLPKRLGFREERLTSAGGWQAELWAPLRSHMKWEDQWVGMHTQRQEAGFFKNVSLMFVLCQRVQRGEESRGVRSGWNLGHCSLTFSLQRVLQLSLSFSNLLRSSKSLPWCAWALLKLIISLSCFKLIWKCPH